ncbi:MFS general substrate transporter [Saccharata proteae CBS 121410]|uniref:MFS general substrate transporter n=1 Tax=Saccharata proteae CBS 121410 TaxID=1314787 RepID=A0A9P4LZ82_9PEZI|nr:MFS general substrate transporter [Saccharata proteae CBS 121410]
MSVPPDQPPQAPSLRAQGAAHEPSLIASAPPSVHSNGGDVEKKSRNSLSSDSDTSPPPAVSADPEKKQGQPIQPQPFVRAHYKGWRWIAVLVAFNISAFLYALDNTIVADIQASTVETFGEVGKLAWLGSGFPLGGIATVLPWGKAYGIFDSKWLYIGALTAFAAGSALCGGAPNMNALIVARVWAGAGGAGMYLGVLNIITHNTNDKERPMYQALIGLIWGIGNILGPVIGGAFADSSATWRWAFYLNLVLLGAASPIYLFLVASYNPQPNTPLLQKLKELDWLGILLNAGVYASFVVLFTFAGTTWSWSDGRTIALFVVFGILLIAFGITQTFSILTTPQARLFPCDFLRDRTMVLLYIATCCSATAVFIPIYYIPLYFQFAQGDDGTEAAVRLLPFIFIFIFCVILNGVLMPKFGVYMPFYLASAILTTIGGALMYSLVDLHSSKSDIYGFSVLIAFTGLCLQAAYSITPVKVPPHRIPDAINFINSAQIGSIVIALTIIGTVFQNVGYQNIKEAVAGLDFTPEDIRAALAGTKSTILTSAAPDVKDRVLEGIVDAINDGYILVIVAGALMAVCAVFMKREKIFMETTAGG